MGGVISKAANGVGGLLANVFTAPLRTLASASCEDVCAGPWDVVCFIEHLCVSNLIKLLMILGLCYITLLFLYLLFKVGICQCIGRSLCKMCWATCETYWSGLEYITRFLWHKLNNTKRRRRRRRWRRRSPDIERGYTSTSCSQSSNYSDKFHHHHLTSIGSRKRKSLIREGRRRKIHSNNSSTSSRHHVRLKSRQVSIRAAKGGSQSLRDHTKQLQLMKPKTLGRKNNLAMFKRRRLR